MKLQEIPFWSLGTNEFHALAILCLIIVFIKLFLVLFNLQGWNVILDEKSMMIKRSTDQHQTNDEKI